MKKQIKFALPAGIRYPAEPSSKKIAKDRRTSLVARAHLVCPRGKSVTAKWLCGTNHGADNIPLLYRDDNTKFGAFVRQMIEVVGAEVDSAAQEAKKRQKAADEQIAAATPEQVEAAEAEAAQVRLGPAKVKLLRTFEKDGCIYGQYEVIGGYGKGDVFEAMIVTDVVWHGKLGEPTVEIDPISVSRAAQRLSRGYRSATEGDATTRGEHVVNEPVTHYPADVLNLNRMYGKLTFPIPMRNLGEGAGLHVTVSEKPGDPMPIWELWGFDNAAEYDKSILGKVGACSKEESGKHPAIR